MPNAGLDNTAHREMGSTAIVPKNEIADLPFMLVNEIGLNLVGEQFVQQRLSFRIVHALDCDGEAGGRK